MACHYVASLSSCLSVHLCNQQPKHNHQSNKQEESRQKLFVHVLRCPRSRWRRSAIIDVKSCCKNTKWKGTDSKRHLETPISKAKPLEATTVFWLRPLPLWSRRRSFSGVLLTCASPSIQGDYFVSADACFTHWTHLSVGSGLQPLMQARPTEEVSTQADDCILSRVQTYITLKSAVLVATVRRSRAAGSGTCVFSGRSSRASGWRGGGGGHLKIDPLSERVQVGGLRWQPAPQRGCLLRSSSPGAATTRRWWIIMRTREMLAYWTKTPRMLGLAWWVLQPVEM